jgi:DNA-binding CsgD family transcriptional regulator
MAMYEKPRQYKLGKPFKGIYFTTREAECMALLLQQNTYKQIAKKLNLSIRTVEFYSLNLKAKLRCNSISELINKVKLTDFMQEVDVVNKQIEKVNLIK